RADRARRDRAAGRRLSALHRSAARAGGELPAKRLSHVPRSNFLVEPTRVRAYLTAHPELAGRAPPARTPAGPRRSPNRSPASTDDMAALPARGLLRRRTGAAVGVAYETVRTRRRERHLTAAADRGARCSCCGALLPRGKAAEPATRRACGRRACQRLA